MSTYNLVSYFGLPFMPLASVALVVFGETFRPPAAICVLPALRRIGEGDSASIGGLVGALLVRAAPLRLSNRPRHTRGTGS